jgi:hypothetical protein
MVKSFVVGGDFNTNPDQAEFAEEKTLSKLTDAGFTNPMEGMPLLQRITHPGSGRYPDATFDYLFGSKIVSSKLRITLSRVSDHYAVTCDFLLPATYADVPQLSTPAPDLARAPDLASGPSPQSTSGPRKDAASSTSPTPQFVTITQPVRVKIPYGEAVLPRGLKLVVLSRTAQTVTVQYLDGTQIIPISSTDLR